MNQKSSLRKILQFVSQALTANNLIGLRIFQALPAEDLAVLIVICKSLPKPLEATFSRVLMFVQRTPGWPDSGLMPDQPVGAKVR
jgi:hypothetical protein